MGTNKLKCSFVAALALQLVSCATPAIDKGDESLALSVAGESGLSLERINGETDTVADYKENNHRSTNESLVMLRHERTRQGSFYKLSWRTAPQIAVSPDGKRIAFIVHTADGTDVVTRNLADKEKSVRHTFSGNIRSVSWSGDGKILCVTVKDGDTHKLWLVDAENKRIIKKVSGSMSDDYCGVLDSINGTLLYHHRNNMDGYDIWCCGLENNTFKCLQEGMSVCPMHDGGTIVYCSRMDGDGVSGIWRIDLATNEAKLILSQSGRSFTSPQLSPNGRWLLLVSGSYYGNSRRFNTDIYAVRTDGTRLTQLTYHPQNDLSPVFSADGKCVYFLSQRGSANGQYNVWRMDFNL